jgi:NADH dehydrogenase FAD-containing subunit
MGPAAPREALRVVIVGGGATGCEVASSIQCLVAAHGGQADIHLPSSGM